MREFKLNSRGEIIDSYSLDGIRTQINSIAHSITNECRVPQIVEMLQKCYDQEELSESDHQLILDILERRKTK